MKRHVLAIALTCLTVAAPAAANDVAPPQLEASRQALAAGVKARDLKAIAAISRFPLAISAYEADEAMSEATFMADGLGFLFFDGDQQLVDCLATAGLMKQSEPDFPDSPWMIECTGNLYYFGEFGKNWRFAAYMNANE